MASICISHIVLLMIAMQSSMLTVADNLFVGVCYGMQGDSLPPAAEVVSMLKQYGIGRVRLYNSDPFALNALKGNNIRVTIGVEDEDLQTIASSKDAAESWFALNMQPYMDSVNFEYVVVGNEVIPGDYSDFVLPAMKNILVVLWSHKLRAVRVTTSVNAEVLLNSYPPSEGEFDPDAYRVLAGVFKLLAGDRSPLMVNLYPYYTCVADPDHVSLDSVMFNATKPVFRDGKLEYYNMLDAKVDAFYWAMEKVGFPNVGLSVSGSGWPSAGNGDFTTPDLASTYNKNFIRHIVSMVGTTKRPKICLESFVFEMFNENLKPAGIDQNWGLFYPNKQPVYPVFSELKHSS